MIRPILFATFIGAVFAPISAFAQDRDQTLADIRAELSQLAGTIQSLRAELVSGDGAGLQAAGGASALDRMNAIESELSRLTGQTEELGNRISRIAADGTTRIGDLEFRLCELEEGCDLSNLPITKELGGGAAPAGAAAMAPSAGPATAAGTEQEDFDRAMAALQAGDAQRAAELFASFAIAYPGGPLTGEAQYQRGEALARGGDTSSAARAYLESFSGAPDGPRAADSLLRLGQSLGQLGQVQEACVALSEVATRFPTAPAVSKSTATMRTLGCQ